MTPTFNTESAERNWPATVRLQTSQTVAASPRRAWSAHRSTGRNGRRGGIEVVAAAPRFVGHHEDRRRARCGVFRNETASEQGRNSEEHERLRPPARLL